MLVGSAGAGLQRPLCKLLSWLCINTHLLAELMLKGPGSLRLSPVPFLQHVASALNAQLMALYCGTPPPYLLNARSAHLQALLHAMFKGSLATPQGSMQKAQLEQPQDMADRAICDSVKQAYTCSSWPKLVLLKRMRSIQYLTVKLMING